MRTRRTWTTHELESALNSKGFVALEAGHIWYRLHDGGKRTHIRTKISHGIREYGVELLKNVAWQMHLTHRELDDFVVCPLTREGYIALMRERGHL